MIHTTTQKGKFRRLVRHVRAVLGVLPVETETVCVGILERLWHATISNAVRGDIGKLDDEEIAEVIGWHGDAQQIISILVETKWIDRCQTHRLVIHDWNEHAPNHVKGTVTKMGGFIVSGVPLRTSIEEVHIGPPQGEPPPNPTKRNQTKPNPTPSFNYRANERDLGIVFSSDDLTQTAHEIFTKLGYRGDKGKNLWKFAALLQATAISENELWDSCQEAAEKARDAPGYAFTCLRNRLRERASPVELADLMKSVSITPFCPSSAPEESLS